MDEVHYEDLIHRLTSNLCAANLEEVQEYAASKEGSLALLQWKFLSNLNKKQGSQTVTGVTVTVSDCPERGNNLLDGTPSEWWSSEETAWVELDLGRAARVSQVRIQWWGISVSKDYTILAAGQDGVFHEVGNTKTGLESPEEYNSWSKVQGWSAKTYKIRIELRDGCLDPWDMGKWFGIRNIVVQECSKPSKLPFSWILADPQIMELLLTSGYVQDHKWSNAVGLINQILDLDPEARKGGYRLRLAVSIAITFSTTVKSFASYDKTEIDPIARYQNFVRWAEEGVFFPIHTSLSTWHLRFVVASWAEDEELEWARENVPGDFRTPDKIGEATHKMVSYTDTNSSGVSIHEGAKFYDYQPQTLALLAELGAVCGGVSKFGVAMAQAFGIPATPVAQPGHCAFLWWNEGQWIISNDVEGLGRSSTHDGIQWSWNKSSQYIMLMEAAQQNREGLVLSEKLRWASKFVSNPCTKVKVLDLATSSCPTNFLVWRDLASTGQIVSADLEGHLNWVEEEACKMDGITEISSRATVTVSSCAERGQNLVDGTTSEWWTSEEEAWVELDLGRATTVSEVRIQWWGISISKNYILLAAGQDGVFHEVGNNGAEVESPKGYNSWSKLNGWSAETCRIRIELKDGCLDPWGKGMWFGIRNILVQGKEVNCPSTLRELLEAKAHKCLAEYRMVETDVCKLITGSN